ncbi:MAG: FAD:protein FMN transferase [Deltaproteobacteria bacterium]|nr:FAD:protein FMN transferase [Deltaproteobacteria bacterium]MBW2171042.1 FAD:protein FMN transferase [Deltaproteobacteria bacterium]
MEGNVMSAQETPQTMDRRRFLKLSGILGVGFAAGGLLPISEAVAFDKDLYKVTKTRPGMGTFVSITVMHPSKTEAEEVIGKAFEEMDRVTLLMDRYRSDSPIGLLNKEGSLAEVPPDVGRVIKRSLHFHKASQGAFDITVQPVVDLYRQHFEAKGVPPSEKELEKALALVDASAMKFDGKSVRFETPGMGITLDGIAKGYVIDCGAESIKSHGIKHALINAGGDIRVAGGKEGGSPWKVGVQNPDKEGPYLDIVKMNNGALATSGNYEIYFDKEKLYHHIVNPSTGLSPAQSDSVTVTASTVMDADALSTAIFVLEPAAGKRFIEGIPGTACLILGRDKQRIVSNAWPS